MQRIPTSWFAAIITGAFLIVTAAFGGLATVQQPDLPRLESGVEHVSDELSITIERAVLIDSFPEAGARAGEGQRVLSLVVDAENRWTEPQPTTGSFTISQALRLDLLGDEVAPEAVARYDDATYAPWLQPGVRAKLVVSWLVPESVLGDGDEITVTIRDASLSVGQMITAGASWGSPKPAALALLRVNDVGAGVQPEAPEEAETAAEAETSSRSDEGGV